MSVLKIKSGNSWVPIETIKGEKGDHGDVDVNKLGLAVNPDDHMLYHYYGGEFVGTGVPWPTEYVSPDSISISSSAISFFELGGEETLTATISPENATNRIVRWRSSDESVVTVSADGVVTSVADGTAVITASTCFGEVISACNVKVRVPVPLPDAFAEYAALNNTGNGIMDTTANTWKDLSGNGYDLDLTMENGVTGTVSRIYTSYDDSSGERGFGWDAARKACIIRHPSSKQGPFISPRKTGLTGFSAVLAYSDSYSIASYSCLAKFENNSSYDGTTETYNTKPALNYDANKPGLTIGKTLVSSPKIKNNNIVVFTEDNSGNYAWWKNGAVIASGTETAPTININHIQFVQRMKVAVCYMAFYDTVLTEQQIKYITETIDEEYDCASIKSVQANIASSGTVPPYMDFYVQPRAYPLSKDASTTKTMTVSDNTVLEVVT